MAKRSIKSGENVNITRYTPTEWANGDIITAEKLNAMESGISAATPFVVVFTGTDTDHNSDCDQTFAVIHDAYDLGRPIIMRYRSMDLNNVVFYDLNFVQNELDFGYMGTYYNVDSDTVTIKCTINTDDRISCQYSKVAASSGGGGGEGGGDAK